TSRCRYPECWSPSGCWARHGLRAPPAVGGRSPVCADAPGCWRVAGFAARTIATWYVSSGVCGIVETRRARRPGAGAWDGFTSPTAFSGWFADLLRRLVDLRLTYLCDERRRSVQENAAFFHTGGSC